MKRRIATILLGISVLLCSGCIFLPVPHELPWAGAAVAVHFWPGFVLTVTIVQVSVPLHGLPSLHESGRIVHENWQLLSTCCVLQGSRAMSRI